MLLRALILCVVAAGASLTPAHAAPASLGHAGDGTFGRPFAVTPEGTQVDDGGAAAVNAGGRVAAVWTAAILRHGFLVGDQIQARIGDMRGRFGPVLHLSDDTAESNAGPLVAVGQGGTVAVVWVQGKGDNQSVRLAVAPPAGRFGAAERIGRGRYIGLVGLTVAGGGGIAAAWNTDTGFQRERAHLALGRPGHLRPVLGGAHGVRGGARSLAGAEDGSALLTFVAVGEPPAMQAVAIASGAAAAGPRVDVPEGMSFAGPGGFAIGLPGNSSDDQRVVVRGADGRFGAPRRVGPYLGETEATVRATVGPYIGLPADGSLSAAWEVSRALNGDNDDEIVAARILAASAPAEGSFGAAQRLSRPGWTAEDPDIAAVGGTTVVVWRESVGVLGRPFSMNFSSRRAGRARFAATRRFPADGWIFPALAAAGGNLVGSWYPFNGYHARHERLMLALWREPPR
jgi:hypothetical protein